MPHVDVPGARIHYEVHGNDGPALTFAHGRGGNAASWWQQVPFFRARHRVVVFDHRGFGRSRCEPEQFDVRHFADDLLAVLDAAGVERTALVCQSMGGRTGLEFAVRHPARVRCLVLACTAGGLDLPAAREASRRRAEAGGGAGFGNLAVAAHYPIDQPQMAFLYDQIRAFNDGSGPAGLDAVAGRDGLDPALLEDYSVPTLMIAAENDRIFPPAVLRAVAPSIPGVELTEVPVLGHSTYFEDAGLFNRLVSGFLDRHA